MGVSGGATTQVTVFDPSAPPPATGISDQLNGGSIAPPATASTATTAPTSGSTAPGPPLASSDVIWTVADTGVTLTVSSGGATQAINPTRELTSSEYGRLVLENPQNIYGWATCTLDDGTYAATSGTEWILAAYSPSVWAAVQTSLADINANVAPQSDPVAIAQAAALALAAGNPPEGTPANPTPAPTTASYIIGGYEYTVPAGGADAAALAAGTVPPDLVGHGVQIQSSPTVEQPAGSTITGNGSSSTADGPTVSTTAQSSPAGTTSGLNGAIEQGFDSSLGTLVYLATIGVTNVWFDTDGNVFTSSGIPTGAKLTAAQVNALLQTGTLPPGSSLPTTGDGGATSPTGSGGGTSIDVAPIAPATSTSTSSGTIFAIIGILVVLAFGLWELRKSRRARREGGA